MDIYLNLILWTALFQDVLKMNVNKDPFSFKAAYREFLDIPKSNLPIIFGLRPISKATYSTGKFISAKTNGFVQLDTFIPNYMRKQSRYFGGYVIAPCNDFVGNFLKLHVLKNTDEQMLSTVFSAPLVEESVYRLPLILLYTKINKRSMEVLKQPTNGSKNLDRMTNKKFVRILTQVNGGGAIKAIAILFSSTVFTYGHGENLNPGRSLSLFVG
jgi:hypothetical protein